MPSVRVVSGDEKRVGCKAFFFLGGREDKIAGMMSFGGYEATANHPTESKAEKGFHVLVTILMFAISVFC